MMGLGVCRLGASSAGLVGYELANGRRTGPRDQAEPSRKTTLTSTASRCGSTSWPAQSGVLACLIAALAQGVSAADPAASSQPTPDAGPQSQQKPSSVVTGENVDAFLARINPSRLLRRVSQHAPANGGQLAGLFGWRRFTLISCVDGRQHGALFDASPVLGLPPLAARGPDVFDAHEKDCSGRREFAPPYYLHFIILSQGHDAGKVISAYGPPTSTKTLKPVFDVSHPTYLEVPGSNGITFHLAHLNPHREIHGLYANSLLLYRKCNSSMCVTDEIGVDDDGNIEQIDVEITASK
jgi:hypothetical protein